MKKSKLLLISAILGTAYLIYIISHFFTGMSSVEGTEQIGAGLATVIVAPHMFLVFLSVIFNWVGWFANASWAALVSGILYSVAAFLFLLYVPFVMVQIILCFVAYSKMKKATKV